GYFAISPGFFSTSGVSNGPITALQAGVDGPNGVFKYGGGFPDGGNTANYWVDVLFSETLTTATSLNYVLTSVTDDNNCNTTAPNISTASVTINPLPVGVLSAQPPFCAGQNVNLVFN
ncbi:MAG TPA: DUF4082 domain-containing protein, partial [Chitinophagaceae bacterium]|nr:DUF4082 domain-containing protein [Chitinophagaceae bacterium]